jgi:hypothetical protein
MTKDSDEGQFLRPSWSKSAMQDEVLQQGAVSLDPLWSKSNVQDKVLQQGAVPEATHDHSPLCVTKSSNKGQFLRPLWSKSAMRDKVFRRGIDP